MTVAGTILCSTAKVAAQGATLPKRAYSFSHKIRLRHAGKHDIYRHTLKRSSAMNIFVAIVIAIAVVLQPEGDLS